ncbi:MAG: hypothetical protein QOJ54_3101 [Aliidongia sp.]|jgi:hypothetical protein|nr:hypothetical protein [Aliidongia sp.]
MMVDGTTRDTEISVPSLGDAILARLGIALASQIGPHFDEWAKVDKVKSDNPEIGLAIDDHINRAGDLDDVGTYIVEKIITTPASSIEGLLVKAMAFRWCRGELMQCDVPVDDFGPTADCQVAASIVRDLMVMVYPLMTARHCTTE